MGRRRLLWSVYLVAVAQLAVAGVAIFVVQRTLERAPWQYEPARHKAIVDGFGEFFDTPEALERALGKLNDIDLTFYALDGRRVASTEPPLPPLSPADFQRLSASAMIFVPYRGPIPITAVPVVRGGAMVGYGLAHRRPPSSRSAVGGVAPHPPHRSAEPLLPPPSRLPIVIGFALLGAAVISFLFARSLARPLARLAAAAEAFGAGDLTARARLERDDELGAVARTFDQMADRVNGLLTAQREFLANVSHELRTPLARIRVALDIATEGDVDSARQCLIEIAQDWGDLDRLVEGVLTVARFDLARDSSQPVVTLQYDPLDARTLVERASVTFSALHPRHHLSLDESGEPIALSGDGAMLRRALDNLLNNAAQYSEPGTTVRLQVRSRDDEVAFSVSDRGMGIDAADLPRLFEPLFRADRSRARKTGGVGLGLAVAKRIVEAHGGRILVESRVGVGTTVAFTVPVEPVGS